MYLFDPFSGPWTTPPGISWTYGEICVLLTHLFTVALLYLCLCLCIITEGIIFSACPSVRPLPNSTCKHNILKTDEPILWKLAQIVWGGQGLKTVKTTPFCREMLCISAAYRLCRRVWPSVMFVYSVKRNKHISKSFSPSGRQLITTSYFKFS